MTNVGVNEYEGFGLFYDIEDVELRNRNRAVVIANMFEMYGALGAGITDKGLGIIRNYFGLLPEADLENVFVQLLQQMDERRIPYSLEDMQ